MSSDRGKLGDFLREVIDWRWDEFCLAEQDTKYTGYQAAVFALVRTCSDRKLGAIKLAIDRVDGKIETPVKIEYPKVYLLYPRATSVAEPSADNSTLKLPAPTDLPEIPPEDEEPKPKESEATLTLRETLEKMADQPRTLVRLILDRKIFVEEKVKSGEKVEDSEAAEKKIPMVKSVIAANLLDLAEKNNFEAITEVFNQIDGKLVETIRVLGDDLFLTEYLLQAPAGAVKNKDGIYMIESKEVADQWKEKLKRD